MKIRHRRGERWVELSWHKNTFYDNIISQIKNFRANILKSMIYSRKKKPQMASVTFRFHYSEGFRKKYKKETGISLPEYWYRNEPFTPGEKITPANLAKFAAEYLEIRTNEEKNRYKDQKRTKLKSATFYLNY